VIKDTPSEDVPEINGDHRLTFAERLTYLGQNAWRNIRAKSSTIRTTFYCPENVSEVSIAASPSRTQTMLFLEEMLNDIVPAKEVRVLEVGCGSGFISDVFAANGYSGEYIGIDIQDRAREKFSYPDAFRRTFVIADAHTFASKSSFDVFFSFSALEHIPNDTKLLNHLDTMLNDGGVHLHIVPAGWSLPVYLWHGYRQYTLSDIEQRFGREDIQVYALGGMLSFLLHFIFITLLETLLRIPARNWFRGLYVILLRRCLRWDRFVPFAPVSFVIHKTKTETP
jgi:SAM-dependent methyltransferase